MMRSFQRGDPQVLGSIARVGGFKPSLRGVAAVELALLLPLLLLIVLGCIDFGRFAHGYFAVTNAARAGAGYGMMHPTTPASQPQWEAAMRDEVLSELSQTLPLYGLVNDDVTTTFVRTEEGGGANLKWRVSVTVTMPFNSFSSFPLLPQNVTLSRETEMRGIR